MNEFCAIWWHYNIITARSMLHIGTLFLVILTTMVAIQRVLHSNWHVWGNLCGFRLLSRSVRCSDFYTLKYLHIFELNVGRIYLFFIWSRPILPEFALVAVAAIIKCVSFHLWNHFHLQRCVVCLVSQIFSEHVVIWERLNLYPYLVW